MDFEFVVQFSARRVVWLPRWLPFNHPRDCWVKWTTWAEAERIAQVLVDGGAWDISIDRVDHARLHSSTVERAS